MKLFNVYIVMVRVIGWAVFRCASS